MAARDDLSPALFGALAVGLPVAGWLLHGTAGHEGDQRFFHDWYLAFRDGAAFYRDGPGLNYPILGVLLVCLPARLVETDGVLDFETYRRVLKLTLVFGEALAIATTASLARVLRAPRPRWVAVGLALLPSFWAPGALFGQIDVWGTAALLGSLAALLRYRSTGKVRDLALGTIGIQVAILIKQLVVFTLPALGLALALGLWRHRRPMHGGIAASSVLLLFVADPFLTLPEGYVSHLWWVVTGGGSAHGDLIVAGGASLWSLVADLNVSAHDWLVFGVRAYVWGIVLFALVQVVLLRRWWSHRASDAALVLYGGASNLAMATLLTGVHERYLVHGAPLLVLGVAAGAFAWEGGLRDRRVFVTTVVIVAWWGLFVLGSVAFDAFVGPLVLFRMHQPIAVLLLVLLVVTSVEIRPRPGLPSEPA